MIVCSTEYAVLWPRRIWRRQKWWYPMTGVCTSYRVCASWRTVCATTWSVSSIMRGTVRWSTYYPVVSRCSLFWNWTRRAVESARPATDGWCSVRRCLSPVTNIMVWGLKTYAMRPPLTDMWCVWSSLVSSAFPGPGVPPVRQIQLATVLQPRATLNAWCLLMWMVVHGPSRRVAPPLLMAT